MKSNVGSVDRAIRILVGLALIGATWMEVIGLWGLIGIIPLATGIFAVCPAYLPFGINTCAARS